MYVYTYMHTYVCTVLMTDMHFATGIGRHSMSIQQKLQVADMYNRISRLKEEQKLLFVEMKQFIIYFKETIPNCLKASIEGM